MAILNNSNAISTAGGYDINNSLRLRASASAYLNKTFTTPTSQNIWTYSVWVKRGSLGINGNIGLSPIGANVQLYFDSTNDKLNWQASNVLTSFVTTQVFRDPSAWYHIVLAFSGGAASNKVRLYVNGNEITAFSTDNRATTTTTIINTAVNHSIGHYLNTPANYFDGYLTEVNFIDGQQLTPSSFGETNTTTGSWVAKKYTGTYGTNGFYLPFTPNLTSSFAGAFNGSTQYLTTPTSTNFDIGTGDFTVEAWVYPTSNSRSIVGALSPQNTSASAQVTMQLEQTSQSWTAYCGNGSTFATISGGQVSTINNWVHIALVKSSGSIKLYVNGVGGTAQTLAGSPSNSKSWCIGGILTPSFISPWFGNISNFRFIKGTALYTSNFTLPSVALTAVTNTQLLTLQNATIIDNSTNAFTITNNGTVTTSTATPFVANITADNSGNANNWTPNNINYSTSGVTYDAMTDVPTLTSETVANYAVLNPLNVTANTPSSGNLQSVLGSTENGITSTIAIPSNVKSYWEITPTSSSTASIGTYAGVTTLTTRMNQAASYSVAGVYAFLAVNNLRLWANGTAGSTATGTLANTSILQVAIDNTTSGSNTYVWIGKDNVWYNSTLGTTGNPATAANPTFTIAKQDFYAYFSGYLNTINVNFGQRPFAYTPPTGFVRLNTFNLPNSTIVKGNTVMDATLYTGAGGTSNITTLTFQPDLIWVKNRSNVVSHCWVDSNRGAPNQLGSDLTAAENSGGNDRTAYGGISTILSNGFTAVSGTDPTYKATNGSGQTYVAWYWKANQGTNTSNTSGSITSTVSVNATAGFSVVTWAAQSTARTVGHGLGVAPSMIIMKDRSGAIQWFVYHASIGAGKYLGLNTTATTTNATVFSTAPTSSVFDPGTGFTTGNGYGNQVAYCWAEVAGFSKFGSYTGNGSANGTFVYTGFRPKFILIKNASVGGGGYGWAMYDTSRNLYNVTNAYLAADLANAETAAVEIDILSNGFKIRTTNASVNGSGNAMIYAAFAENPFKNANAR